MKLSFCSLIQSIRTKILEPTYYGQGIRFIIFILLYSLSRFLTHGIDTFDYGSSFWGTIHLFLAKFILSATYFILHPLYPSIEISNHLTMLIGNREVIMMLPACTGFNQILRMIIVLAFYPIRWRQKTWLGPLSVLIVLTGAIIHFTLLVPIANSDPAYYNFAHSTVTLVIFYSFYFSCWLMWEKVGFKKNLKRV